VEFGANVVIKNGLLKVSEGDIFKKMFGIMILNKSLFGRIHILVNLLKRINPTITFLEQ